jgi:hypothetical protein
MIQKDMSRILGCSIRTIQRDAANRRWEAREVVRRLRARGLVVTEETAVRIWNATSASKQGRKNG